MPESALWSSTPTSEKTAEKPRTKSTLLRNIFARSSGEYLSWTLVPARKVRYAGMSGRTQGLRKETMPARNAIGIENSAIRNHPRSAIKLYSRISRSLPAYVHERREPERLQGVERERDAAHLRAVILYHHYLAVDGREVLHHEHRCEDDEPGRELGLQAHVVRCVDVYERDQKYDVDCADDGS